MWGAWSRAKQSECNSLPTGGREGGKEGEREREGVRERGTEGGVVEGMGKKGEDERETCHEQHNINSLIKTE